MIKKLAAISYNFFLEYVLAVLCMFFFYISINGLPPFWSVFCIAFGGFVPFIFLLEKFANKGKLLYLFIVFPLLIFWGIQEGFQVLSVIIIGLLIFWRGISLFVDHSAESNTMFIFISFMIGILLIIYSGMNHYSYQMVIIGLMILQIILVLIGLFYSKWHTITENKGKYILYYGGILGGVAILGTIITFGLKLIQFIFFGLAALIVKIFAYIIIPIQYFLQFFMKLFGLKKRDYELTKVETSDVKDKVQKITESNSDFWFTIFLIALALFAAYYIYKKKNIIISRNNSASTVAVYEDDTLDQGGFFFTKRVKPPKDLIRSEIFQLEKFAHKQKIGRRPFESLTEWWARIGINESEELSRIYENVRYGELPSTSEDLSKVKAEINSIKQKIKDIEK